VKPPPKLPKTDIILKPIEVGTENAVILTLIERWYSSQILLFCYEHDGGFEPQKAEEYQGLYPLPTDEKEMRRQEAVLDL
jgi:hypothetical protein